MDNMIDLNTFADGEFAEKVNIALKEVLENIVDEETDFDKKRKLIIEMTFQSDSQRRIISVNIVAKPKLIPSKDLMAQILIDTDGRGGILASEFNRQIKGQNFMRIDEETGEISTEDSSLKIVK